MTDIDELDRIWREGLSAAVTTMPPVGDPTVRVAERVRRRRRARTTLTVVVGAVAVAVIGVVVLVASLTGSPQRTRFATSPPVVRVAVVIGTDLQIHFPGRRVSGRPPRVELRHGLIRFDVRTSGASHRLVINGVPGFVASVGGSHDAVTVTVRLAPGRYLMRCTIRGHAEAGEQATLIVK